MKESEVERHLWGRMSKGGAWIEQAERQPQILAIHHAPLLAPPLPAREAHHGFSFAYLRRQLAPHPRGRMGKGGAGHAPAGPRFGRGGMGAGRCGVNLFDKTCSDYTKDAYYVHLYATLYETSTNCGRPEDCPDAPVGDQCRASLMYETDLNGGTLQDVSVNDWAECCDVCSSDPDCRAWCAEGEGTSSVHAGSAAL